MKFVSASSTGLNGTGTRFLSLVFPLAFSG